MRYFHEVVFLEGTFNLLRGLASIYLYQISWENHQVWISEANSGVSNKSAKNVRTVIRNK